MGLTRQQALDYFNSPDLIGLGFEADAVRRRLHPEGVVSYIIDRNINYTNFCTEYCTFCAFYRPLPKNGKSDPLSAEGYILDFEKIYEKIAETVEMGGTGVLMQGGIHPDLKIDWFERLFTGIKQRFPQIWLHCLSASEVLAIAEYSDLNLRDTIARLRDAGLDSIPGGGAEIFNEKIRKKICPEKATSEQWLNVHKAAHKCGIFSNATMLYGHVEKFEDRVDHLNRLRGLQDETGKFNAFIPLKFRNLNNELSELKETTLIEDMRNYAISRIFLDNFPHIKAYWPMLGKQQAQIALSFGVDDIDGTINDSTSIYTAAGVDEPALTVEELCGLIISAGYIPAERYSDYSLVKQKS